MDIVENRVVGMKSRGVYETPGGRSSSGLNDVSFVKFEFYFTGNIFLCRFNTGNQKKFIKILKAIVLRTFL